MLSYPARYETAARYYDPTHCRIINFNVCGILICVK